MRDLKREHETELQRLKALHREEVEAVKAAHSHMRSATNHTPSSLWLDQGGILVTVFLYSWVWANTATVWLEPLGRPQL